MFIDDVVGYFSPNKKLNRIRARHAISVMEKTHQRKYDAATKGRRGDGWKATGTSSASEIASVLPTLRDRSREMVRNNPYAARGVQVIPHNVVGKGIRLVFNSNSDAKEESLKKVWNAWAESKECDFDNKHDLYGLQLLAMRAVVESGEVLLRKRKVKREKGKISIKLQLLEADFLASDEIISDTKTGHNIVQGIEFDKKGQIVAYHIYETHPGNSALENSFNSRKTIRVDASDIEHIFRIDRPGQIRGVPWLTNCMLRLRDFSDYEDAQLIRQKLAASYMAFIKDIEVQEPDDDDEIELLTGFEPGAIEFLPPGKDIVLSSPPEVSENYADYARVTLQSVATGLGVTYESLTGNLKDINFSSFRGGWLEFQRNIDVWRSTIMKNGFNDPVKKWFEDAAEMEGLPISEMKSNWIAPRREMIDPTKEVPALIKAVEGKIKTISEVIREQGKHPEDHFEELASDKAILDKLGLNEQNEINNNAPTTVNKKTGEK